MDFYEEASLVMVPSGYKDQKVYSSVPDDGSGDLTFSRASTATRVNSDGYIEKAQVNLLLQSNTFNTTWLNQLGGTITGGQSGYDDTNDAWLLSKDTSTFRSVRQVISFAGVVTYSAYVKAGTLSNAALRIDSSAGALQVLYDLSAGTATLSGGANIAYGIDSIGSGWYRIFVTANISGGTNVHVYVDRDGTTAGNIYIQDAQLNYGLVAQDYVETTTASVTEGVAIDVPRLNYDPVNPTSASLLLEPSRTNLIAQSEYINGWNKSGAPTITTNIAISPDGTTNASGIQSEDAINYKSITQNISLSANSTLTLSVFVKKETSETAYGGFTMYFQGGTAKIVYGIVDAVNGTVTYASSTLTATTKVEDYGNYWRISSTATDTGSNTLCSVGYYGTLSTNGTSLEQGIGSVRTIWGLQAELGSYPTSYIPTYGTSATRTEDFSEVTFTDNTIAPTANTTLFFEVQLTGLLDEIPNTGGFNLYNQAGTNIRLNFNYGYGRIYSNYASGSTTSFYVPNVGDTIKVAFQLTNGGKSFVNGVYNNTTSTDWSTDTFGNVEFLYGHLVKQYIIFDSVLSEAECIELTTL